MLGDEGKYGGEVEKTL